MRVGKLHIHLCICRKKFSKGTQMLEMSVRMTNGRRFEVKWGKTILYHFLETETDANSLPTHSRLGSQLVRKMLGYSLGKCWCFHWLFHPLQCIRYTKCQLELANSVKLLNEFYQDQCFWHACMMNFPARLSKEKKAKLLDFPLGPLSNFLQSPV